MILFRIVDCFTENDELYFDGAILYMASWSAIQINTPATNQHSAILKYDDETMQKCDWHHCQCQWISEITSLTSTSAAFFRKRRRIYMELWITWVRSNTPRRQRKFQPVSRTKTRTSFLLIHLFSSLLVEAFYCFPLIFFRVTTIKLRFYEKAHYTKHYIP